MSKKIQILIFCIVVVILLALVPVLKNDTVINLLILVLLYSMLGTSWNILGGFTGQTNLGHAAFFGAGALTTRLLWLNGTNLFLSILAGGLVAVVFAMVVGGAAFRLKGVYFSIGMLALAQVAFVTVNNALPSISSLRPQMIVSYSLVPRYYLFLGMAVLMIVATYLLINSKIGLGMKAVREEESAAESLGVNALQHKLIALAVSAFFAALAGGAYAYYTLSYYPSFTFSPGWTFDSITMVFIGGTGTIVGPIIGAIFYVILRQLMILKLGEWHVIVFSTLFIAVILFLPGGLVEVWSKLKARFFAKGKKTTAKLTAKDKE